jgi:lantibiotic modifying enzyme
LKKLVTKLDDIAIKEPDGSLKWESIKYGTDDEIIYNISLSHGIASIINILTRIYKVEIEQEKCKYLINGAIKYLLKQEIDRTKFNSFFPSWAVESEEKLTGSRLGWCYGDLGIAVTLWQAGEALKNSSWTVKAIEVLKYAATRKDLQANVVADAGLCHGTAGIGHIFYRMWWNTRLPEFKEAADYWFNETLKMAVHSDGLAGYKAWHGGENSGWVNEVGLLEGVAGIGLALMTYHYEMEPTWDECLLLS